MLNIISQQGNAHQNHNERPFTPTRMAIMKKKGNKLSFDEDIDKSKPSYIAGFEM